MKYIGIMTGNSMDAIDLVIIDWVDKKNFAPVHTLTIEFSNEMRQSADSLRALVFDKTAREINALPTFHHFHDAYIKQVARAVHQLLADANLTTRDITAIGFHGKTLDHNPPSKAKHVPSLPYTLQIGSGQMLADLTGIDIIYDFRSDDLMQGGDGAPLIPAFSALMAAQEGTLNKIDLNAGNTSNIALILDGKARQGWDAGPCNAFPDAFMRLIFANKKAYDVDGDYGLKGALDTELLQALFNAGRPFYELPPPKSGDPAFYNQAQIFAQIKQAYPNLQPHQQAFCDIMHTLAYFAGYVAAYALHDVATPVPVITLFGGGWHNPVITGAFTDLIKGKAFVLPEHRNLFNQIRARFSSAQIRPSQHEKYMEAGLCAAMAYYTDHGLCWTTPSLTGVSAPCICGIKATHASQVVQCYSDKVCRAAKGWQNK